MTGEGYPDKPRLGDAVHQVATTCARALVTVGVPPDVAESVVEATSMFFPAPLQKRQKEFIDGLADKARRGGLAWKVLLVVAVIEIVAFSALGLYKKHSRVDAFVVQRVKMLRTQHL